MTQLYLYASGRRSARRRLVAVAESAAAGPHSWGAKRDRGGVAAGRRRVSRRPRPPRASSGMFACVRPAPGRRARRRPRGRAQYDPRGPVGRPRAGRTDRGAAYRAPNPAASVRNCPPRSPPTREAFRAAAVPAPVPWWERPPKRADGVSVGIGRARRRTARLRGAQGSATDPLRRAGGPASPRGGPRRRTRCREDPHRRSPVAPRDRHQCARRLARTRSRVRRRRVRNMSRGAAPGGSHP